VDISRARQIKIGGTHADDLRWLAEASRGCKRIVELGSCQGRSTRAMLDNSEARIWCIDTWQGPTTPLSKKNYQVSETDFQVFLDNIKDYLDRVIILKMLTCEAANALPLGLFDMIFIDADHSFEAVQTDIRLYAPLVVPGGILCGHDYEAKKWPEVARAVNELVANPRRAGRTLWWTRREEGWLVTQL